MKAMVPVLWEEFMDSVTRQSTCSTVVYVSEVEPSMSSTVTRLTLFGEAFDEFGKGVEVFRESSVDL
jgi:hypothetical protein